MSGRGERAGGPVGAFVRRLITVPVVMAAELFILVTSPLLLLGAAVACIPARSTLPVRTAALLVAYAATELPLLPRILVNDIDDWNELLRQVVDRLHRAMRTLLDVTVVEQEGSVPPADLRGSGGVIVLARHCGPGDTLFIAWLLAVRHRLRLRVVLTALLRLVPSIDVAGDHLPFCFVDPRRRDRSGIADVARSMRSGDALLLFPEGQNFSRPRWQQALAALATSGATGRFQILRRNTHTLPPRLGGTFAALTAAPEADVVFLAHSGFTDDGLDRPIWRLPVHRRLLIRTDRVAAADVPRDDHDALSAWLDRAWTGVDRWIATTVAETLDSAVHTTPEHGTAPEAGPDPAPRTA